MPAATKPCARVRLAAASAAVVPSLGRRVAGRSRPANLSSPGGDARTTLLTGQRRVGATKAAALGSRSSNASSTAAPSIGAPSPSNSDDSALLPDAFALLGLNRAAARASVIHAYEEAVQNEIEEGFSKVREEQRS